jgi:hypothetical protein
MLYFDHAEERLARVEKMIEELTRKPAPPRPAARVVVATGPPGTALPTPLSRTDGQAGLGSC